MAGYGAPPAWGAGYAQGYGYPGYPVQGAYGAPHAAYGQPGMQQPAPQGAGQAANAQPPVQADGATQPGAQPQQGTGAAAPQCVHWERKTLEEIVSSSWTVSTSHILHENMPSLTYLHINCRGNGPWYGYMTEQAWIQAYKQYYGQPPAPSSYPPGHYPGMVGCAFVCFGIQRSPPEEGCSAATDPWALPSVISAVFAAFSREFGSAFRIAVCSCLL